MSIHTTMTLPSGRSVRLEMPNLYAILMQVGKVPSPQVAAVMKLLSDVGLLDDGINEAQRMENRRQHLIGLYHVAELCLVEPRLKLKEEPAEGEIGPADLSFRDVEVIYYDFFRGIHPLGPADPGTGDSGGAPGPARAGDDVSQPSERDPGDG